MRFAVLAVVLVAGYGPGVAHAPRREFRDGAMVESPPVFTQPGHTPAGAGLPEYMPGAPKPSAPRGTDRRVLPPTLEPRIYASGGPTISDATIPRLIGIEIPIPEDADDEDRATALKCAAAMNTMANVASGRSVEVTLRRFMKIPEGQRTCVAATLYLACVDTMWSEYESQRIKGNLLNRETADGLRRLHAKASAFKKTSCPLVTLGADATSLMDETLAVWHREIRRLQNAE